MQALGGYQATRTENELIVHDVPIFCSCERDEMVFDAEWIKQAVAAAKLHESEGYLPPMHARHHEPGVEPIPAGTFRIKGTSQIRMKGRPRVAVLADLHFTNPEVIDRVLAKQYPYRSVEIFNVHEPGLNGLALLDHEAPFLELPMLMVGKVHDQTATEPKYAPDSAFASAWHMDSKRDGAVMAHFRRGATAHLLFSGDGSMADDYEDDAKKDRDEDSVNMEADSDTERDDDSMDMMDGEGGIDAGAVITAIEDGSISIADFDAIKAAMEARIGATEEPVEMEAEEEPDEDEMIAPANLPSRDAMRAKPTIDAANFAKMQGKIDALEAAQKEYEKRERARQAAQQRKDDVSVAMKRLETRPLGDLEKLEKKLVSFHREHGPKAFAAYVDSMAEAVPEWPSDAGGRPLKLGVSRPANKIAMKYQASGTEAVEQAMRFSAEWAELKETGHTRRSEEQYVDAAMKRVGLASVATSNGTVQHG